MFSHARSPSGSGRPLSDGSRKKLSKRFSSNAENNHPIETTIHPVTTTDTEKPLTGVDCREFREEDCYDQLGYSFSTLKKWRILTIIWCVQVSMNLNAAIFGNAVAPLSEVFDVNERTVSYGGMMAFLVAYAFGCELWAPWSEEWGRKSILQWSLGLVNLWALLAGVVAYTVPAGGIGAIILFRILGGFSSAGGSVTLAIVADLYRSHDHGSALAFIVLSSVGGSVIGAIAGGPVEQYLDVHWNFWIQVILGVFVQISHLIGVPETRSSVLTTRETQYRRRTDPAFDLYSTEELHKKKLTMKEICAIWIRPFKMFITEPIVLWLSLLSGFADAFIFSCIASFPPLYALWDFSATQTSLSFVPVAIGNLISFAMCLGFNRWDKNKRLKDPERAPESRLVFLLWTIWFMPVGLAILAWPGSWGPAYGIPWIVPMIASCFIGIANYAIYYATIDYMIDAYMEYSASATGGNGFSRDFLAGIAFIYTGPLYKDLSGGNYQKYHLSLGTTVMLGLACALLIPVFIFYFYGPWFRARSKFAQQLGREAAVRQHNLDEKRRSSMVV